MHKIIGNIWSKGFYEATTMLLMRREGEFAEDVIFTVWSNTIAKILKQINGEKNFLLASKEEKIEVFKGKLFSFENFKTEILDCQIKMDAQGIS